MEEKVLIKSKKDNIATLFAGISVLFIILTYIVLFSYTAPYWREEEPLWFMPYWDGFNMWCWLICLVLIIVCWIIYLVVYNCELTVTDKRIYGKVAWGKRVDLPIDSVSATGTIPLLKGVSVSTSSGRISFCAIKNTEDIYKVINNLLLDRQKKSNTEVVSVHGVDAADQLKKFKELLDSGVITQEEFDAKKKQLLGL